MLYLMALLNPTAAGIYVHVPFCLRKCCYCDFYSVTDLTLKPAFLKSLSSEIATVEGGALVFDTIYLGGGTPSILRPQEVGRILNDLFSKFRFEGPVEITLEANPGTVDYERLKGYRAAGVTRLNIGVQSFQKKNLAVLGRIHSAEQAHAALADARRVGFESIGIDLIYGLPGQRLPAWRSDLESALQHQPEHIACYMLTVERGTPLADEQRIGRFQTASEDRMAALFIATSEFLTSHGFRHYEIANFARCRADGRDAWISRHNSKYWVYAPYLGLGPAAHSFLPPKRSWNHRDVRRYLDDLNAGRRPLAGEEVLTADQEQMEVIMLGLRTAAGIDLRGFQERFGIDFRQAVGAAAENLAAQGLLSFQDGCCVPTLRGMLYLNSVTAALTGC
jgi:oxygen-independent coproporphyrinogen-3 oxidase